MNMNWKNVKSESLNTFWWYFNMDISGENYAIAAIVNGVEQHFHDAHTVW